MGKWQMKLLSNGLVLSLLCGVLLYNAGANAEDPELPPLAKMRDANKNNRIERNEASLRSIRLFLLASLIFASGGNSGSSAFAPALYKSTPHNNESTSPLDKSFICHFPISLSCFLSYMSD